MYPSPSSVAFESGREPVWYLKERVVLTWHDHDNNRALHLGEPSPLNKDASLVLWLGLDQADNRAAAMLQLTVTHYVKGKRKRFDLFSIPTGLQLIDDELPILGLDDIPSDISYMFGNVEGCSKSRFLRLSLCKNIASLSLMPIRNSTRAVQGAAEHVMLSAQAFAESATGFEVYMGYSTYAHQALTREMHALESRYTVPSFNLESSYSHNGGAFNLWDDYLDTKSTRTATNADADLEHRHAHRRKRARHHQGETGPDGDDQCSQTKGQGPRTTEADAPPAYSKACEPVQVPASDCAPSPRSTKCRDGDSVVPLTPLAQAFSWTHSILLSRFGLGPLFLHASPPPQRPLPLDDQLIPLMNGRSDINSTFHKAFATWLFNMGKLRPYIHEDPDLYTMLVAYGLAVQREDITRFPNIKARATSLVLKAHVTCIAEPRDWAIPAEKLVQKLVRWMCGLVLHADEELINDLLLLTQMAIGLARHDDPSAVALARREEYLLQEATCVANFFVTYAQPLSRHLEI
ncbi:hypothetical protein E4T42_05347 [Aureobasidium subglaciale]|nr:hypothetical protein E4T42_05347 [Aureobasidium subglaciale]